VNQWNLLYLLIALGVVWTAIWLYIILNAHRIEDEPVVDQKVAVYRRRLVFPVGTALLIGVAFSLYFMPYPGVRGRTIGKPIVSVDVSALQWGWVMNQQEIPANTSVEFVLTSQDVNHDFAIYDPAGDLVTQAQVMPGYTNRLIFEFDKPGTYTVRCLEYCGIGHDIMVATFDVV